MEQVMAALISIQNKLDKQKKTYTQKRRRGDGDGNIKYKKNIERK